MINSLDEDIIEQIKAAKSQCMQTMGIYVPHICHINLKHISENKEQFTFTLLKKVLSLIDLVMRYFSKLYIFENALDIANLGVMISEMVNGSMHSDTSLSLNNLAGLYESQ